MILDCRQASGCAANAGRSGLTRRPCDILKAPFMPTGAQLNTQWEADHLNCAILGNDEPRGDFSNRMDALCLAAVTGPGFCDPTDVRILPMPPLCILPLSGPTKQYIYFAYASGEAHLLSLENQIILPAMRVCSCIPSLQLSDKLRMCTIELLRSLRAEKAGTDLANCMFRSGKQLMLLEAFLSLQSLGSFTSLAGCR